MNTLKNIKTAGAKHLLLFLLFITSNLSFAQDVPEKVDVNINADGGTAWYGQPWMWAVGVAIFILILVIVTRNNKSADA